MVGKANIGPCNALRLVNILRDIVVNKVNPRSTRLNVVNVATSSINKSSDVQRNTSEKNRVDFTQHTKGGRAPIVANMLSLRDKLVYWCGRCRLMWHVLSEVGQTNLSSFSKRTRSNRFLMNEIFGHSGFLVLQVVKIGSWCLRGITCTLLFVVVKYRSRPHGNDSFCQSTCLF